MSQQIFLSKSPICEKELQHTLLQPKLPWENLLSEVSAIAMHDIPFRLHQQSTHLAYFP